MRILLTHGYFLNEDKKELQIMKPYPPLGLQYISAFLDQHGFENYLLDTTFSSFESLKQFLDDFRPDIIGIYVNLMTRLQVLRIINYIKGTQGLGKARIVLGGPEVRHHRENFLSNGADIIVLGEGEQTMLEIVQFYSKSGNGSNTDLSDIQGIVFRDSNGEYTMTQERSFIPKIDDLPVPAREKIDHQQYFTVWRKYHGYSMVSMNTMRGCPYGCKWCSRAVYGKSYRRRSPEKVVDEISWLKTHYDFDRIWFVDDVFTINHKWLRKFSAIIQNKDLITPYEAITRADRMNKEIIKLLRDSGCFRIWIGAESGSQSVLDAMNRMVKIEQVIEMTQMAQNYGLETGNFIMLGYPGETEKDIRSTLHYLKQADPDHFTMTVAYPIKGTPFYDEVESRFLTDLPWENSSDRDIDFIRTYPRRYYDHAMNWINREMSSYKNRKEGVLGAALFWKGKALFSRIKMGSEKWLMTIKNRGSYFTVL